MKGKRKHVPRLNVSRLVAPLIILALAAVLSIGIADRFNTELLDRFEQDAEDSLELATVRLDNYRDLLYAGRAFVVSSQKVTSGEWKSFYNQQAVFERYPGVSSIAYVRNVATEDLPAFQVEMRSPEYFGPSYALGEMSQRPFHGLVTDYVSHNDLTAIEGMDLLRLDDRYAVYAAAEAKGTVVLSPPFKLATGYEGFFSVLPVYRDDELDGYILSSFRFDDLMRALFEDESFGYEVTDVTTDEPTRLYKSAAYSPNGNALEQTVEVGERRWKVVMTRDAEDRPAGYLLPAAIMTTALILALTLYANHKRTPFRKR
jgi:hypothetical protein